MVNRKMRQGVAAAAAVAIVMLVFVKPLRRVDSDMSDLAFRLRGPVKMDTSIVVLAIRDSLLDSIGGVPLRPAYYSKLIDALDNLRVKAIGICIPFEPSIGEKRMQIGRLIDAFRKAGNVCIGGFFNKVGSDLHPGLVRQLSPKSFSEFQVHSRPSHFPAGTDFTLPPGGLVRSAAGVGHLNTGSSLVKRSLPMFVQAGDSLKHRRVILVPSVVVELLRICLGVPRDSVIVDRGRIVIRDGSGSIEIPVEHGSMRINYCGGVGELNIYPATSFLAHYVEYHNHERDWASLRKLRNKIVLIGLDAHHLGEFCITPFAKRFPIAGVYANALDTALRRRFLRKPPPLITFLLAVMIAGGLFSSITNRRTPVGRAIAKGAITLAAYQAVAFGLFSLNIILSFQPVLAGTAAILVGVVYRLRRVTAHSLNVEKEKARVENLHERDSRKISLLEKELESIKRHFGGMLEGHAGTNSEMLQTREAGPDDSQEYEWKNDSTDFENINGIAHAKHGKMKRVLDLATKVAASDATILILGESGTGKELIAETIHKFSNRNEGPFIAINCGAIPESLLESELFGHEEGAYTSANKTKKGLFEAADHGTIFLDEIAETSEFFQTKLLRVLQSGEFNRVGGTETIKVDIRVLAATNRAIDKLVRDQKFRKDLYYRLNVIRIFVPPLRERKDDIPSLVRYFLLKEDAAGMRVAKSVMDSFLNYDWPGNVRELESVIKRSVILARAEKREMIYSKDTPSEIFVRSKTSTDVESQIVDSLRRKRFTRSSIKETAMEVGGIHRGTVAEHLKGFCFKYFCECNFNTKETARKIACTDDAEVLERIENKLNEYLSNFVRNIDTSIPAAETKEKISLKYKKLPTRYHTYLHAMVDRLYERDGDSRD